MTNSENSGSGTGRLMRPERPSSQRNLAACGPSAAHGA